ncbi:PLP-dependent transferase [Cellulophaga baltica]|uniref:PLP-dependent transferase n=1 Tax=Cellulophaga baltica TaxID=76594 RepID=UPI00040CC776|nr:PLP-dependent transferase [Cellulophaga baltica]MBA6316286.1 cystathionine beta-synthase [Cellulophaga baltica]
MKDMEVDTFIKAVLEQMPKAWLTTTTHRLDIYDEKLAKTEFLTQFEVLFQDNTASLSALDALPTAYDYIRLGHPLSCVLEWTIAKLHNLKSENVISFSSKTMPVLAILRKNLLAHKKTRIVFLGALPSCFNAELIKIVYGYTFEFTNIKTVAEITAFEGSTILLAEQELGTTISHPNIDFTVSLHAELGSILVVHDKKNAAYISDIQHVRRRETIAMTPSNSLKALKVLVAKATLEKSTSIVAENKAEVLQLIASVTGTNSKALVASSGLSIQYAIMMGLVDDAQDKHPGKPIKFIVPPNCYGGTNDQARRVAACLDNVEVVDLPVDGGHDMIHSIDAILDDLAKKDAVPYIIAEIPTNPRVEVPDLQQLKVVLTKERKTATGGIAIDPVFILDQTFCPNVLFLGEGKILSSVRTISYVSGSKFPSGGQCTAGYCVANVKSDALLDKIETHLMLCDNEATPLQYKLLATQLSSMNQRISAAYKNTRQFVNFIQTTLPAAKINFVSEALAAQGFTPSVFSLDLPTKGTTDKEKEDYKRTLNLKLINLMINEIPDESKFCVSYGQLKGCYWTVPATSTQGTTKEGDKDYIVRASLSPDLDLQRHKEVFLKFVKSI